MSRVKFGDVVKRININVDRFNTDRLYYIGKGATIESDALTVEPHGRINATLGFKFHFGFNPGHILFMSRCFDQHKAATATFAGICSDSTYVVETKDESVLLQRYLQLEMQSDRFWRWCEEHKSGGVNYLINYSTLETYEFDLPSLAEQKVLAEKLWAAYEVKQSYLKMIAATEEMVKAQFIEMFGGVTNSNPLFNVIAVTFPGEWGEDDNDGTGIKVIRTTNFTNIGKLNMKDVVTRKIDPVKISKKKLQKGDIILERSGGTNENPVGRVVYFEEDGDFLFNNFTQLLRCKNEYNSIFVFYALFCYYQSNKTALRQMAKKTTGIMNLKMDDYWKIPIPDVDLEAQEKFVKIYKQADKSISELRKSVDAIDKVIKSLINENL